MKIFGFNLCVFKMFRFCVCFCVYYFDICLIVQLVQEFWCEVVDDDGCFCFENVFCVFKCYGFEVKNISFGCCVNYGKFVVDLVGCNGQVFVEFFSIVDNVQVLRSWFDYDDIGFFVDIMDDGLMSEVMIFRGELVVFMVIK